MRQADLSSSCGSLCLNDNVGETEKEISVANNDASQFFDIDGEFTNE